VGAALRAEHCGKVKLVLVGCEMKIWTKAEIKSLLESSDKAVVRGLLVLYGRQTQEEQQVGETRVHNLKGFNALDAELLTSFSEQYKAKAFLSSKQLEVARKRIMKYAGQLTDVANENEAKKEFRLT